MFLYLCMIIGFFISVYTIINPEDFIRQGWFVDGEPILWVKILTIIRGVLGVICCALYLILYWFI